MPRAKTTVSVLATRLVLNLKPPLMMTAVRFAAEERSPSALGMALARRNAGLALTKVIGPLPKTDQGLAMAATSKAPNGPFWPTMVPPR